jgi:hypothetical protein
MAALENEARRPDSLGSVLCVLAAPNGGWVEIVEAHRLPGAPPETGELVGYFLLHGRDRSLLAPIAWPHDTQMELARFLAGLARMTFRFPQRASFRDLAGGVTIEATALNDPAAVRRDILVSFAIRASSALTGSTLETELTLQQSALSSIARSCCARFPGLDAADWHAAWS